MHLWGGAEQATDQDEKTKTRDDNDKKTQARDKEKRQSQHTTHTTRTEEDSRRQSQEKKKTKGRATKDRAKPRVVIVGVCKRGELTSAPHEETSEGRKSPALGEP
jgi:hypothetical protein